MYKEEIYALPTQAFVEACFVRVPVRQMDSIVIEKCSVM